MSSPAIRRALISVSNKLGIADFARALAGRGVEIFSTGGTRRHLESEGIPVRDVADYTGFPEMMEGRLKTLHPMIFGGLLCRRDREDDMESADEHGILPFELVAVNLYPFEATIRREGVTEAEAIEQIDIGGPSLVRAAAKNSAFVTIATGSEQYAAILAEVEAGGATSPALRRRLMCAAFAHTAVYDRAIAGYFAGSSENDAAESNAFPDAFCLSWTKKADLRYGENPHQRAAVYAAPGQAGASLVSAEQLHGKELSYNNLLDLDGALAIVRSLPDPSAAVIKHNNPCGAASAETLAEAARHALDGDPTSAFGSVLGFNRPVDLATAEVLATPGLFIEAIVAPGFEEAAVEALTTRPKWKKNVRLLKVSGIDSPPEAMQIRQIEGGLLVQEGDAALSAREEWQVVTEAQPDDALLCELEFAWALVRHVKSNAIVLSRGRALCGVGAGQMSRVDSVEIAVKKAGERARGAALASDAFFPFPDSIEAAHAAKVAAIIQPGGSRNDRASIDACNERNLPMVFTGRRHFRH